MELFLLIMKNNDDKKWTLLEMVNWGTEYFSGKDIDSPRLTIELLLCKVLGIDRIGIYANFEKPLSALELAEIKQLVIRRVKREPLQYITGITNFLGIDIKVDKGVLIPRPETELLAEKAIDYIDKNKVDKVLDIGTGSGCIAIAIAKKFPGLKVCAVDVSKEAISQAKNNASLNNISNIDFIELDILNSGAYSILKGGDKFGLIVSNPPYIEKKEYALLEPEVRDYEPGNALTDEADGLTFYRKFADIFHDLMADSAKFFLEIGYGQFLSVKEIFGKNGFNIKSFKDFNGIERIICNE